MTKKYKVAIIGTGSLGTALSHLLLKNGHDISIFDYQTQAIKQFKKTIKDNYQVCQSIFDCIHNTDIVIPCLPSRALDEFYQTYLQIPVKKRPKIISASKGLFPDTNQTISQYLTRKIDLNKFIVFSGPTFADEIINQHPTSCIISSINTNNKKIARALFDNNYFHTVFTDNTLATEYNGIFKNCYAISIGILTRLKYGMNTKSLAVIKIIEEIIPFYKKHQLDWTSIYSLSFLGDFIATGLNPNSRNFQAGFQLQKKEKVTSEGTDNMAKILNIAHKNKVELPILNQTNKILNKKARPISLVKYLFK